MALKSPFPYFGGKSKVAGLVWSRFGDVPNYVEPFFGSGAVLLGRPHEPKTETVNDADAFLCLGPSTRLLTADLHWRTAGEIQVGQKLIAFDESNGAAREGLRAPTHYRHWKTTEVAAVQRTIKPCYRLTFDDGTTVVASADHLWLGGSHRPGHKGGRAWRWQTTAAMRCDKGDQRSCVMKICDVATREDSYDAGWLAGFYDGEGSVANTVGWRVVLSQKLGLELDRAYTLLTARGFDVHKLMVNRGKSDKPHYLRMGNLQLNGGMRETLRMLMTVRPERLISNIVAALPKMSIYGREHQAVGLVSKEFIGDQEVIAIETDSHTFIAEGLASHNCNFWRAVQHDPGAVAQWADWPVNENDLHARHLWLVNEGRAHVERLTVDPDYYDAKIAGWWVWGISQWIGGGWCSSGSGDAGKGVHRKRAHLSGAGMGVHAQRAVDLVGYMAALAERLRRVRVCCGDWTRVCGPTPTFGCGMTAVFLDPPYSAEANRDMAIYSEDSGTVAHDVRAWCLENGDNPLLRIALCGYQGEHDMPDRWEKVSWKGHGGYGNLGQARGRQNATRETIWFSPGCLRTDGPTQLAMEFS